MMTVEQFERKNKRQSFQGEDAYFRFLKGGKITRREAMLAKCYECMGGYDDGKMDCCGESCPIFPFYPYKR